MTAVNERTRRSALNYVSGVFLSIASLAVALVTTPLILRWLGPERFGAARAAADWFGHITVLEFGLGGALAPLLALALGRGDEASVRRTMAEGVRAFVRVSLGAVIAGVIITLFMDRLVPVSPGLTRDLRAGCVIAVAGLLLYPLAPFRQLADAGQRGYIVNVTAFVQSLTTVGLAVWLARVGMGITGQFVAMTAGLLVFSLLITGDGLRRHPGIVRAAAREPRDEVARAEIRRLNTPSLLFDLSGRAGLLTDNIVVALMLGPAAVVPLFFTQRLPQLAQAQLQSVGNASWAALGELHALGRHDVFNDRLVELTRLTAALSLAALLPIMAYNHVFIRLWVGDSHYGGPVVTALAGVNGFLLALVSLWGWCFSGTGRIATLVPVMLISSALNVTLSILGAWRYGIAGPLLGTSIAIAGTTFWYLPLQLHRTFGTPLGALVRAVVAPVMWAAAPALGIIWLARHAPPHGWPGLATAMAAGSSLLIGVWWFGELGHAERAHYRERVRMVVRRRNG